MRVNYLIDTDNIIRGYTVVPFNPAEPFIEVESVSAIHIGFSQVINGYFMANDEAFEEAETIRKSRNAIQAEITQLKRNLANTDYEAIKFSEGELTAEEFEPYRVQRHAWRVRIRELEAQLDE